MKTILLLVTFFTIHFTANAAVANTDFQIQADSDEIKVGTYNVLNLFDTEHDEDKQDYSFLPMAHPLKKAGCATIRNEFYRNFCFKTDWTPERLKIKLGQIKVALSEQGPLPDVLGVVEIENEKVLKMLAETLGYKKYLITDSKDKRGVDVALLWNPDKLDYIEHGEIELGDVITFDSRNILRVHFHPKSAPANAIFGVYMNHWPAMMSPAKNRMAAARKLTAEIDTQTKKIGKDRYYYVALGDFNTPDNEIPNAFHHVMYSPTWDNQMHDVQSLFEAANSSMRFKIPPTSYYYSGSQNWVKFDRIAASRNLLHGEGPGLVIPSFRIVGTATMMRTVSFEGRSADFYPLSQLIPKRYNANATKPEEAGFSDHLPVIVKIKWTSFSKTLEHLKE